MGYLGSSLDDYFSYELIDKVIDQINNNNFGDINKLSESVEELNKVLKERKGKNVHVTYEKVKISPMLHEMDMEALEQCNLASSKVPIQPFKHDTKDGPCECGAWHKKKVKKGAKKK